MVFISTLISTLLNWSIHCIPGKNAKKQKGGAASILLWELRGTGNYPQPLKCISKLPIIHTLNVLFHRMLPTLMGLCLGSRLTWNSLPLLNCPLCLFFPAFRAPAKAHLLAESCLTGRWLRKADRAGDIARTIECLLSTQEVLGLIPKMI